ncbi:Bax inhibitor-1/YccA family protein [Sinimarinibacterium sp. CAU 1509]|uniref:Bax inhibitor-1/YccA family protein n=1 Tax=Sinimarinibacterium sp. CAU 1509 TaxID=2562283 RepID=UPI0010AB69F0|nr:Bax inhibitor-1/YccA family protein [Sinimarinibacterium sp. CAU 1509]TJY59338.1 Bax inhibitor-1/YccA family protein [Sinimarinibacterium sp. CAU 1509]
MSLNPNLRPVPVPTDRRETLYRAAGVSDASLLSTHTVLRNTYLLLSMTLLFSAAMAALSMAIAVPYGLSLVCSLVAMGLLWFAVPRTANSTNGIYVVFAITGLLGFGLGPVLNMYIKGFSNGPQIVSMALGLTGATFVGLSAYAIRTRKDFSFMRGMLFSGIMLAFVLSIGMLVASMFGLYLQPLALGISAMFALLMCGLILYQTSEIIHGGETNYILATVTLYVSIYNLFTSLLHLLGFAAGED